MIKPGVEGGPVTPCSILPVSPTPTGNLGVLPREIRDQIYGHLMSRLRSCYPYLCVEVMIQTDPCGKIQANFDGSRYPILRTSACICREVMAVLYSEKVFTLRQLYTLGRKDEFIDKIFVDLIMNVEVSRYQTKLPESLMFISLFAGTKVLRKTFFMCMDYVPEVTLESPLADTIKQLIGFKTVTLHVIPGRGLRTIDDFNASVQATRQAFEPALGPSTKYSSSSEPDSGDHDIGVTFRPRDYLSQGAPGGEGASAQPDRPNDALPLESSPT